MSINKYNPTTGELELLAGGTSTLYAEAPIGSIMPYGGATAPDGFLLCQGQAVSRTTYAELFAVIGTSFGSGDGSTTFNVPDLRGEFLRGAGTNSHSGQGNGGTVGQHQDATTVPYFGTFLFGDLVTLEPTVAGDGSRQYTTNYDKAITSSATKYWSLYQNTKNENTLQDTPVSGTVRPTNTSVNYIIKATQVSVPADFAPVDTVANGNMKAVTSNAVAKVINHTNELVWNTEYIDTGSWNSGGLFERCGFVLLDKILSLKANCPSGALICTGFPRPIVGMEIPISFDNALMGGGLFLDTDGNLRVYATSSENVEVFRVNFIYMKNL